MADHEVVESVENQNSDVLVAHLHVHCLHIAVHWYVVVVVLVHWLFVEM